ncbi:MAG: hypothetical protein J6C12_04185 [Lachnospiraceae bacterium]|nr:hypothetical protein [Lachnospiraceae bacterium]
MTESAKENKRAYMREYMKRYRRENRERLNENRRKWAAENPDKIKAYHDAYWEKRAISQ